MVDGMCGTRSREESGREFGIGWAAGEGGSR